MSTTIRTFLVEDNYLAAQYIHDLLSNQPIVDLHVLESQSLAKATEIHSGSCLVLIDQSYFSSEPFSFGRKLKMCFPRSGLIIIGGDVYGKRAQRVFQEWVFATVEYAEIKQLPLAVFRAVTCFSRGKTRRRDLSAFPNFDALLYMHLSRREMEVLELVSLRLSNKEIATLLNVTEATVKFHVSNAFAKIGIRRRRELFSFLDRQIQPVDVSA